jgi:hypothetical protein
MAISTAAAATTTKLLNSKTGFCQFHCSEFYYSEAEALGRILAKEIAVADIAPHRVHAAVAGLLHDDAFGFTGGGGSGDSRRAVGDLNSRRSNLPSSIRIQAVPISGEHLNVWMQTKPLGKAIGGSHWEQVNHL